jgi:hypothetical protein
MGALQVTQVETTSITVSIHNLSAGKKIYLNLYGEILPAVNGKAITCKDRHPNTFEKLDTE